MLPHPSHIVPRLSSLLLAALCLLSGPAARGADEDAAPPTRSYDVGPLLEARGGRRAPWLGLGPVELPAFELVDFEWGSWDVERPDDDEPEPEAPIAEDALLELLCARVPGLGEEEGEAVEVRSGRLFVTAAPERQVAVAGVLARLWAAVRGRVAVEAELWGLEAAAEHADLLERLATGSVDDATHAALAAAAGSTGTRFSTVAVPGRRTWLGQVATRAYLADYAVEIAQDSIVGNPVVRRVPDGAAIEVRPFVLQGGGVFLEVYAQVARLHEPMRRMDLVVTPFGQVDLPAVDVLRFAMARVLNDGERRAIVLQDGDGRVRVLVVRAERRGGGGERGEGLLGVGALTTPPDVYEALRLDDLDPDLGLALGGMGPPVLARRLDVEPLFERDELADLLQGAAAEEDAWSEAGRWVVPSGAGLWVGAPEDWQRRMEASLVQHETAWLAPWRVTLRLREQSGGGPSSVRAAAALDATPGRVFSLIAGTERAYVADWDVEVAQEARSGDPLVRSAFGGLALNLRLDPTPLVETLALRLEVDLSTLAVPFEVLHPDNDCTGPIELPRAERLVLREDLVVDVGQPLVRELGRRADGRVLEVEIRVARP